jgi:hypothetical protein
MCVCVCVCERERERERESMNSILCTYPNLLFSFSILQWSQSGYHLEEDLPKFGYKQDMKVNKSKHPSIFLATYCNLF